VPSYAADSPALETGKVTPAELGRMKDRGQKIAMVTAYDAPSGRLADRAGVDCVLVGDSAAMTMFGRDSTVSMTMEEMLLLTRATRSGVQPRAAHRRHAVRLLSVSDVAASEHAIRLVKEAGADAVKLEGAGTSVRRIVAIVGAGIPVVGHLGLTPQSRRLLGGLKAQGRTADRRTDVPGCRGAGTGWMLRHRLEAIPEPVARRISCAARVPTIGIGAGAACDGQVLVCTICSACPTATSRGSSSATRHSVTIFSALFTLRQRRSRVAVSRSLSHLPHAKVRAGNSSRTTSNDSYALA